jgi:hypothetical protein
MKIRNPIALGSGLLPLLLLAPQAAHAYFEDLCISARTNKIVACVESMASCKKQPSEGKACPVQLVQAVKQIAAPVPARSMVHTDATYFLAQALGYRADVAYWIVAYNEVADYTRYAPIDQCGVQATTSNSGRSYITATFNGFQRTNNTTDGPLYHYVLPFSPNGTGTDVHGASGVQAVYPFHFPNPGYPAVIDDVYEGSLYNLRQWAMQTGDEPGLLCAAGLTTANGASNFSGPACRTGIAVQGTVPMITKAAAGVQVTFNSGPKILDNSNGDVSYEQLGPWLKDKSRTTGVLWQDPSAPPVPVQLARIGLYIHSMQDTASHSTYCGDDAPSPPGGADVGSYMALDANNLKLVFGATCATAPHIAGHAEETATGDAPLPLRDYTALNMTLNELIIFGNTVAKAKGWIANPDLLPPNVTGGKNALGQSAADLQATLVGTITQGTPWTRSEVYQSGLTTRPLQQLTALNRLHAMNAALMSYSDTVQKQYADPKQFAPFQPMPGNARDVQDTSKCFK